MTTNLQQLMTKHQAAGLYGNNGQDPLAALALVGVVDCADIKHVSNVCPPGFGHTSALYLCMMLAKEVCTLDSENDELRKKLNESSEQHRIHANLFRTLIEAIPDDEPEINVPPLPDRHGARQIMADLEATLESAKDLSHVAVTMRLEVECLNQRVRDLLQDLRV